MQVLVSLLTVEKGSIRVRRCELTTYFSKLHNIKPTMSTATSFTCYAAGLLFFCGYPRLLTLFSDMSSTTTGMKPLSKSPSTSTICVYDVLGAASPSVYRCIDTQLGASLKSDETLVVCPTTAFAEFTVPREYPNIASYVSHSAGNLLYDNDEISSLASHGNDRLWHSMADLNALDKGNKPTPSRFSEGQQRPRHHHRSTTAPGRLTIPHHSALLSVSVASLPSLLEGPRGYQQAPLSTRPNEYESLRNDFGIRFKKRESFAALLLHWDRFNDEDAAPNRLRERVVQSAGRKKDRVKGWFKKGGGFFCVKSRSAQHRPSLDQIDGSHR